MNPFVFVFLLTVSLQAADTLDTFIEEQRPSLIQLYEHLHAHPELSFHEEKTSARMAEEMRKAGFEVTEKVGGFGVVAVLKNGPGRTVLVRTDLDGLPVREIGSVPYASKTKTKDDAGNDVSVMHACGHDIHMTCWVGAARALVASKNQWQGTLVFIAQPAEERGAGALAMIEDGLFQRFPKPDVCLALHCDSGLATGTAGFSSGPATSNTDTVDIVVKGIGGHGAMPNMTKDPIVLASQIVLALQTIDSRELHPVEPVVVTVGKFIGGTKSNIIPDKVELGLTVRTTSPETRKQVLDAIKRICRGLGIAAGLPENLLPEITLSGAGTPSLHNDPALTTRVTQVWADAFGKANILERKPTMAGEDFSRYTMTPENIPVFLAWIGTVSPEKIKQANASGEILPSLHSPFYRPEPAPSITFGIKAMTLAVMNELKRD
ncbi:amidohydrolase [Prosthecobacter sp.]|uniref:M20 metallopeptidase family protein n=1 Tax=Prosthecobacter sp. TaxID=1965333 RepID=UPI00248845C8|nr:amidohydrolase [Prosthecobacter sp.]MDI1311104.1 amidohydrolase [Prosthecobacter sp.]